MTARRDSIILLARIVPLREEKHLSYAAIGRIVKLHKSWVSKLYRKWRFSIDQRPGGGVTSET